VAGLAAGVPRTLAGRYRPVQLLARGGMAEVWEGRDDVLSRPVAIKILLPHLAVDPYLQERFRREAITAARLVHPGIVAIFDAGVEVIDEDGSPGLALSDGWSRGEPHRPEMTWGDHPSTAFIVMELVPGETLRQLMVRCGPLTPELAVTIASQANDALAHAHAHGLVHRDIKPANVLLRDEGADMFRVKVADFGIAKATATTGDLTANGTFLGTPKYVSPEQVQGREPDPRADLYSLGVVLFEMLAGRPPFQESTDMATALAHVQKAPPNLAHLRPGLPDGLADLVGSLLVKDPDYRVGSALALGASLAVLSKRIGAPAGEVGSNLAHRPSGPSVASARSNSARSGSASPADLVVTGPKSRRSAPASVAAGPPKAPIGATMSFPRGRVKAETAGSHQRRQPHRRRHTSRLTGIVVLSLLVAGSVVALIIFDRHPGAKGQGAGQDQGPGRPATSRTSPLAPPGTYKAVAVVEVKELAENGNRANDDLSGLPNVIGDNPDAFWQSAQYHGPDFGNYGGLGLVLKLGSLHLLHELVVKTPMRDWSAETYVANSYASTLNGWGAPTGALTDVNGSQVFSLGDKRGSWVLFWMLNPGPSDQATVDKVSVR
jgi:eukaryotic-like serine/threonine-protein kinase